MTGSPIPKINNKILLFGVEETTSVPGTIGIQFEPKFKVILFVEPVQLGSVISAVTTIWNLPVNW